MTKELLEHRLNGLIREIEGIRRKILSDKLEKEENTKDRLNRWRTLANNVSLKWQGASIIEEIRRQRDKD